MTTASESGESRENLHLLLPGFLSPLLLESCFFPPLKEPSSEILKHIQEEVRVCNDILYHHLDRPKTNHTASFRLHPESICIPDQRWGQATINFRNLKAKISRTFFSFRNKMFKLTNTNSDFSFIGYMELCRTNIKKWSNSDNILGYKMYQDISNDWTILNPGLFFLTNEWTINIRIA